MLLWKCTKYIPWSLFATSHQIQNCKTNINPMQKKQNVDIFVAPQPGNLNDLLIKHRLHRITHARLEVDKVPLPFLRTFGQDIYTMAHIPTRWVHIVR